MNVSDSKMSPISDDASVEATCSPSLESQHSDTSNSERATFSPIEPMASTSSSSLQTPERNESESSQCELQSKVCDETQTASEFLPEKSYYYNSKHSYIFPGAELWWKDSDNESVSSDSSSGDDDDVTDIEIDNIRNELEQSYTTQENSQLNSNYDIFFTDKQAQKDHDSSSCSSNQYDSTTDSGIVQTVDYTFTNSTASTTITTTAKTQPATATSSMDDTGLQIFRKRNASPIIDDVTSPDPIEAADVENVQKRMKLSEILLVSNNAINSSDDISEN